MACVEGGNGHTVNDYFVSEETERPITAFPGSSLIKLMVSLNYLMSFSTPVENENSPDFPKGELKEALKR